MFCRQNSFFFFFQAEDGIRDYKVTGVQTCALPICNRGAHNLHDPSRRYHDRVARQYDSIYDDPYWHFHDELTWRTVKPHVPRDLAAQCLDLGCGTGKWGLKLLKSGFATTFVDHSAAMIEQARRKT